MGDLQIISEVLKRNRYTVRIFDSKEKAADYLADTLAGITIGFGDSQTLSQMGLYERLKKKNIVYDPAQTGDDNDAFLEMAKHCLQAEVFITSVNALSADGVIVNLDGTGNRVAGSLFGHRKVFYVIGRNKIAPTLKDAVWRVRNIAAPKNAKRLKLRTPCAVRGDKCYDCASPDRICNGLLIEMRKMNDMEMEVILIDEDLGF